MQDEPFISQKPPTPTSILKIHNYAQRVKILGNTPSVDISYRGPKDVQKVISSRVL